MSALTLRLPDDKHARLKALARGRRTSVNGLMEEMATVMIAEADAETRFAFRVTAGEDSKHEAWRSFEKRARRMAGYGRPSSTIAVSWPLGIAGFRLSGLQSV